MFLIAREWTFICYTSYVYTKYLSLYYANKRLQVYGTLKGLEQSMNPQLIKYSRETDTSIALARRENRKPLFSLYSNMSRVKASTGNSSEHNIDPYKEQFGHRIFIKCESLKFRLQAPIDEKETLCQVEPYQTTLCLFDAKHARKLTENFYFDVNHEIVQGMIKELSPNSIMTESNENISIPEELKTVPLDWIKHPKQVFV